MGVCYRGKKRSSILPGNQYEDLLRNQYKEKIDYNFIG